MEKQNLQIQKKTQNNVQKYVHINNNYYVNNG